MQMQVVRYLVNNRNVGSAGSADTRRIQQSRKEIEGHMRQSVCWLLQHCIEAPFRDLT